MMTAAPQEAPAQGSTPSLPTDQTKDRAQADRLYSCRLPALTDRASLFGDKHVSD